MKQKPGKKKRESRREKKEKEGKRKENLKLNRNLGNQKAKKRKEVIVKRNRNQ